MSEVFGSSGGTSTQQAIELPEKDYQANMRQKLTGVAGNLIDQSGDMVTTGNNVSRNATGLFGNYLNGDVSGWQNIASKAIQPAVQSAYGNLLSDAASRGVINSSSFDAGQKSIADSATNAMYDKYNQYGGLLSQYGQMGSNLYSQGMGMTQPGQNLYSGWLNYQRGLSSPATTVVQQGSSGMLPGLLSAFG